VEAEAHVLEGPQSKDMMSSSPWKTHNSKSLEESQPKDTMFSSREKTHNSTSTQNLHSLY